MKNKDQNIAAKQHIDDLIIQAPVAIGFLKGPNLIIESANINILELWGKQTDIIGWPLALALKQDDVKPVQDAYESGHICYGYETPIRLNRNGYVNLFYFDFVYQPVKDSSNNLAGVMVVATEVTKQVIARQLLEDAEERLRLAIEATGIGTWDLDLVSNDVIASPTLSVIFGLDPEDTVTRRELQDLIHPDDKQMVNNSYKKAV